MKKLIKERIIKLAKLNKLNYLKGFQSVNESERKTIINFLITMKVIELVGKKDFKFIGENKEIHEEIYKEQFEKL